MTSVLIVTGAAGFIGCNLVAEVNRRGSSDMVLVDSLGTDEKWRNLVGLRFEGFAECDSCGRLEISRG